MEKTEGLRPEVERELAAFVEAAKAAWGGDLRAVVLYGSAAEGKLRATSDVNVMLVLRQFAREQANALREPFRTARAAIRLAVMFVLEGELQQATDAFAVKFDDLLARHRVLHGDDPFAGLEISPHAARDRLVQVLLNLRLRLRERYTLTSLRAEQLADIVADAASPLRSCAATLLKLEGHPVDNPKSALARIVAEEGEPRLEAVLSRISEARETGALGADGAEQLVFDLMDLTERLLARAERLG